MGRSAWRDKISLLFLSPLDNAHSASGSRRPTKPGPQAILWPSRLFFAAKDNLENKSLTPIPLGSEFTGNIRPFCIPHSAPGSPLGQVPLTQLSAEGSSLTHDDQLLRLELPESNPWQIDASAFKRQCNRQLLRLALYAGPITHGASGRVPNRGFHRTADAALRTAHRHGCRATSTSSHAPAQAGFLAHRLGGLRGPTVVRQAVIQPDRVDRRALPFSGHSGIANGDRKSGSRSCSGRSSGFRIPARFNSPALGPFRECRARDSHVEPEAVSAAARAMSG